MPYQNWDVELGFSTGYSMRTVLGDLGFGGAVSFGVGMKTYDAARYRPASEDIRDNIGNWRLGNKLIEKTTLNHLDLSYNPSKGYYLSERLTWAGLLPAPLESQQYFKTESKIEAYATLFSIPVLENWNLKWVLGAHSGYQTLSAHPGNPLTVTDDWLYLDGVFNARGWKELYGFQGVGLWENWVELRMPIFEQYLWVDGFFDAAALQTQAGLVDMNPVANPDSPAVDVTKPTFSNLGWNNMAMSVGVGVRFAIQQFPFRFYFAWPFVFDGSTIQWKNYQLVISITQPL
jgi:outer membrane protein insertion porin family